MNGTKEELSVNGFPAREFRTGALSSNLYGVDASSRRHLL